MSLRTYKAYSMAEALEAVRQDLGPHAVILHTRATKQGGILGIGRRTIVEVTAQSGDERRDEARRQFVVPPSPPNLAAARQAYRDAAPITSSLRSSAPEKLVPRLSDQERTRRLAQALLQQHERDHAARSIDMMDESKLVEARTPPSIDRPSASRGEAVRLEAAAPVARRFVLGAPGGSTPAPVRTEPARTAVVLDPRQTSGHAGFAVAAAGHGPAMQEELSAIRTMVGQVLQRQAQRGVAPSMMPKPLFDMYLKLLAQDVSEELADRMIAAVRSELREPQLDEPETVRQALLRRLAAYLPTVETGLDAVAPDGRPLTIALVGPTGVGKTTTLAKLAASYKLRHKRNVGLITSDTYRIAAVDQLRTYADIIGLPLEVVLTPADMTKAMHALRDREVILIDTAGRGQNDRGRIEELRQFLDAACPHEIHLVLSSTASEKALVREAAAFAAVGADRVLLTKLDEAVSFGVMVNVMQQLGKKLSFVTTGQEVPDHLEPGRSDRLAELVLAGGWTP